MRHVDEVIGELHHILESGAGISQRQSEIFKGFRHLRAEITGSADQPVVEIEAELPEGPEPRIILNRLASRVFGPAPSLSEAEKALQRKADGGITSDWEAAAASVNLGGSISHHRPRSKIVRDVAVLVDRLTAPAEAGRRRA